MERQPRGPAGLDYSQVAALRDDLMNGYRRNNLGVLGGWMQVNEARAKAGLPEDPEGDVYLRRALPEEVSPRRHGDTEKVSPDRMYGMDSIGASPGF